VTLKESYKTAQEKLLKAKTFIKNQDKLFKEEHAKMGSSAPGTYDEAAATYQSQIKVLEEEAARQKVSSSSSSPFLSSFTRSDPLSLSLYLK
jgi:protein HOOK3